MPINFTKNELYQIYNILRYYTLLEEENLLEDDEFGDHQELDAANHVNTNIQIAYQGLEDGAEAILSLNFEEAAVIIKMLNIRISESEEERITEDDPTGHYPEYIYNLSNIQKKIRHHFKEKIAIFNDNISNNLAIED